MGGVISQIISNMVMIKLKMRYLEKLVNKIFIYTCYFDDFFKNNKTNSN